MSQATSPSTGKPYGLARVCRVWGVARSTVYWLSRCIGEILYASPVVLAPAVVVSPCVCALPQH